MPAALIEFLFPENDDQRVSMLHFGRSMLNVVCISEQRDHIEDIVRKKNAKSTEFR